MACMKAHFRILRRNTYGRYYPVINNDIEILDVGGFDFRCGEKDVSFNWDDFVCRKKGEIYEYTALGEFSLFDLEQDISDLPTDEGLADVLANAVQIDDFFVKFEVGLGKCAFAGQIITNGDKNTVYKVELLSLYFTKSDGSKLPVSEEVITNYNKGIVKY